MVAHRLGVGFWTRRYRENRRNIGLLHSPLCRQLSRRCFPLLASCSIRPRLRSRVHCPMATTSRHGTIAATCHGHDSRPADDPCFVGVCAARRRTSTNGLPPKSAGGRNTGWPLPEFPDTRTWFIGSAHLTIWLALTQQAYLSRRAVWTPQWQAGCRSPPPEKRWRETLYAGEETLRFLKSCLQVVAITKRKVSTAVGNVLRGIARGDAQLHELGGPPSAASGPVPAQCGARVIIRSAHKGARIHR